jgi:hypothetical protein
MVLYTNRFENQVDEMTKRGRKQIKCRRKEKERCSLSQFCCYANTHTSNKYDPIIDATTFRSKHDAMVETTNCCSTDSSCYHETRARTRPTTENDPTERVGAGNQRFCFP